MGGKYHMYEQTYCTMEKMYEKIYCAVILVLGCQNRISPPQMIGQKQLKKMLNNDLKWLDKQWLYTGTVDR
jgi:hypothetical protein